MARWVGGVMMLCALAAGVASAAKDPGETFQAALDRFLVGEEQLVPAWRQLHATHWPEDPSYTGQMLATVDAMVGRYAHARQEFERAFDRARPSTAGCPAGIGKGSFRAWLSAHAAAVDLVMVNEAHTEPVTRALVYQMLPLLRRKGYTILAMEALYDHGIADAIDARGYPLDDKASFYYLREPIEGELLREAKRLGFRLMSYETETSERDARERGQAANLLAILQQHPGAKVFVVAGHGHVYRENGRMAQQLARLHARPFLSINQLGWKESPVLDACAAVPAGVPAYSLASMAWKPGGHGTDVTVIRPGNYALKRGSVGSGWLTLGGARSRHRFTTAPCGPGSNACLVEARYADEQDDAVPADRYLAGQGEEHADLYLRDGHYRVSYRDAAGKLRKSETIAVVHGSLSISR